MGKLHVDSLTKSFDGKSILKDIYISCETGKSSEFWAEMARENQLCSK